ncbi:hypothetical protein CBS101457_001467 [Exobasidium rhododendri]|nr:hypothetical protein CBS101457_001467 [Exobasidium rhododendri]
MSVNRGSSAFVLDTSQPSVKQIIFDDDIDAIFASVPEEQLDQAFYTKSAKETQASNLRRHEIIDVDDCDSIYEEDSSLDEIFASLDEDVAASGQITTFKSNAHGSRDDVLTNASSRHRQIAQDDTGNAGKGWTATIPITNDKITRHKSALQKDILNTIYPSKTKQPSRIRQYSTLPEPHAAKPYSNATKPSWKASLEAEKAKETKKQELEDGLAFYSYLRPAGKISSMRKGEEEAQLDFAAKLKEVALHSVVEITVSTHRTPSLRVLSDASIMERELKVIQSGQVLSFDMEWPATRVAGRPQGKTSVIQIASPTHLFILQVGGMKMLPAEITRIVTDPSIVKCGVAIRGDAIKLRRDFEVAMTNMVELSSMAKLVDADLWKGIFHLISLRDLCRVYLKRRLKKDLRVRASAWGSSLDEQQTEYAASDAYVGLEIIHSMAAIIVGKSNSVDSSSSSGAFSPFDHAEVKEAVEKSQCPSLHDIPSPRALNGTKASAASVQKVTRIDEQEGAGKPSGVEDSVMLTATAESKARPSSQEATALPVGDVDARETHDDFSKMGRFNATKRRNAMGKHGVEHAMRKQNGAASSATESDLIKNFEQNSEGSSSKKQNPRKHLCKEIMELSSAFKAIDEVFRDGLGKQSDAMTTADDSNAKKDVTVVNIDVQKKPDIDNLRTQERRRTVKGRGPPSRVFAKQPEGKDRESKQYDLMSDEIRRKWLEGGIYTTQLGDEYDIHPTSVMFHILRSASRARLPLTDTEKAKFTFALRYDSNKHLKEKFKWYLSEQNVLSEEDFLRLREKKEGRTRVESESSTTSNTSNLSY